MNPVNSGHELIVVKPGLMSFAFSEGLQQEIHNKVVRGEWPSCLILHELEPVLTYGRNVGALGRKQGVIDDIKNLDFLPADRGGKITAHMPGQLVVYPILPLPRWGLSVRDYVQRLEQVAIDLLQALGLHSCRDLKYPGVWVGSKKIAALGVRVKQRVSQYGLALNVSPNLEIFEKIVPCGISNRGVCSLKTHLGANVPSVQEVSLLFEEEFLQVFDCDSRETGRICKS